jgi:hypothetical protein
LDVVGAMDSKPVAIGASITESSFWGAAKRPSKRMRRKQIGAAARGGS